MEIINMKLITSPKKLLEELAQSLLEADPKKIEEVYLAWPELARSIAFIIESSTEIDAPTLWWGPAQITVFCDSVNEVRKAMTIDSGGITSIICNTCGSSSHGIVQ